MCPGSRLVQPRFARNTPGHTPDTGQCTIDVDIILCDAFDREALVKARPDFGAAELRQARYRRRGSLDVISQNASNAVIDLPRAMSAGVDGDRRSSYRTAPSLRAWRAG